MVNSKSDSGFPRTPSQLPASQGGAENVEQPLGRKTVKQTGGPVDGSSRHVPGEKLKNLRVGVSRPLGSWISLRNLERDIKGYKADDGLELVERALEVIDQLRVRTKNQSLRSKIRVIEKELVKLQQSGMVRGDFYNFATDVRSWLEKELKSSE
ncbi:MULTISPECIES: hypothetical protein [Pseudomonadota]|uniref:hypothetical protein n=1 Tax=Pseudomonadota TaxID=1224 RepID=UPI00326671D6